MDVATFLRTCRSEAGLTQRQLADRAGTSAAAVCHYERGTRVPRADTLVRLVAATGATLTWRAHRFPAEPAAISATTAPISDRPPAIFRPASICGRADGSFSSQRICFRDAP